MSVRYCGIKSREEGLMIELDCVLMTWPCLVTSVCSLAELPMTPLIHLDQLSGSRSII